MMRKKSLSSLATFRFSMYVGNKNLQYVFLKVFFLPPLRGGLSSNTILECNVLYFLPPHVF